MGAIASQITSLTIVYSTDYSDADQRKLQSSTSLAFVQGIHRGPVNSPHKWPVTRKNFPFDDIIMYGTRTERVNVSWSIWFKFPSRLLDVIDNKQAVVQIMARCQTGKPFFHYLIKKYKMLIFNKTAADAAVGYLNFSWLVCGALDHSSPLAAAQVQVQAAHDFPLTPECQ